MLNNNNNDNNTLKSFFEKKLIPIKISGHISLKEEYIGPYFN